MQDAINAAIQSKIAEIRDAVDAGVDVDHAIAEARARSTLGPASRQRIVDAVNTWTGKNA